MAKRVRLASVQGHVAERPPERTRVLIVDDVAQNRVLLGVLCDQFGFQHEPAENGHEAVELVQSGRFDVSSPPSGK